jgi:CpeT/CpcT family (DUF1001)
MRLGMKNCLLFLSIALLVACVNQHEMRKRDIQHFMQTASGEFRNEAGDTLVMVPVYARMIGLDTMYVERTTRNGPSARLLALEPSGDGNKVLQISYVFTQQAQWRNLLTQPELLTALQPNDVRAAGTCDIKLSDDLNSVTYSCGGGTPTVYQRVQHNIPD